MQEVFKDVPTYEGIYQVSNLGRVKSLQRTILRGETKLLLKEKFLKGRVQGHKRKQYLSVILCDNTYRKQFQVHQLVAMAFLNHTPCGLELVIDHINDDSFDNRLENLQIVTNRFNAYKTQGKGSSKYKGVTWCKIKNKWRTRARNKGKEIFIGYFDNEEEAGSAYIEYCNENFN